METGLRLFVQLYRPKQEETFRRMIACLRHNSSLPCIRAITVMSQGVPIRSRDPRLRVVPINQPMTFAGLLRQASRSCDPAASHFALANTDIFLSEDLQAVLAHLQNPSMAVALTRHEQSGDLHPYPLWSQDVWLFQRHLPCPELLAACEIRLGVAGCENLFAMALHAHGYQLWNPCLDCRVMHHDPDPRSHEDPAPGETASLRYHGAYLFLPPCKTDAVGVRAPEYRMRVHRMRFKMGVSEPESSESESN